MNRIYERWSKQGDRSERARALVAAGEEAKEAPLASSILGFGPSSSSSPVSLALFSPGACLFA